MEKIAPGATIGMLGGGQLGRMFCLAARAMGYEVIVYTDEENCPAAQIATKVICAAYLDQAALAQFAAEVAVVTLEFENIPVETLQFLSTLVPVYPDQATLYVAQNREREKDFLAAGNFPIASFALIKEADQIEMKMASVGYPAVLKTAGFGYDGKGQKVVTSLEEARQAYLKLSQSNKQTEVVAEAFIEIDKEFSLIGARNYQNRVSCFEVFGPIENKHVNHILDVSSLPARLTEDLVEQSIAITRQIMEKLDTIGLLCVEFFLTKDGEILVNELAPRPHNSGHLTIEACATSQFEQQLRAICGLTLGATTPFLSAAMVNLLGDLWPPGGEPDFASALSVSQAHLHLYGKAEARPGRKMGHITAVAESSSLAIELALKARASL